MNISPLIVTMVADSNVNVALLLALFPKVVPFPPSFMVIFIWLTPKR